MTERRRRPMERIGALLPDAARRLGLEEELRLARASAAWNAILAEMVPAAAGASRLLRIEREGAVVEADHPIVAQELRLHQIELAASLSAALGGPRISAIRVVIARRV